MSRAVIPNLRGLNNHSILLMILWLRKSRCACPGCLCLQSLMWLKSMSDKASRAIFRAPLGWSIQGGPLPRWQLVLVVGRSSTGLLTTVPPHSPCSVTISVARLPTEHLTSPEPNSPRGQGRAARPLRSHSFPSSILQ